MKHLQTSTWSRQPFDYDIYAPIRLYAAGIFTPLWLVGRRTKVALCMGSSQECCIRTRTLGWNELNGCRPRGTLAASIHHLSAYQRSFARCSNFMFARFLENLQLPPCWTARRGGVPGSPSQGYPPSSSRFQREARSRLRAQLCDRGPCSESLWRPHGLERGLCSKGNAKAKAFPVASGDMSIVTATV